MPEDNSGFEFSVLEKINGFLYRCKADDVDTMIGMTSGIERIFGYPVADLIGNRVRTYASLIHPDDFRGTDVIVKRCLTDRTNYNIDYRLIAADGRAIWVHETGGGVWDARGEILYCEGAVTDIDALFKRMQHRTDQLAEAALKTTDVLESMRYLKLLALNAGIGAGGQRGGRLCGAGARNAETRLSVGRDGEDDYRPVSC